MFIQSLRLHDFRSYHQVLLTPPAGVTVFVGENGAGKTNLLEAVHLCCLGRSHRTAFDREMIRAGQETAAVQVRVQRADGVDEVGVRLYSPLQKKRKLLYINGKTAARTGELMGHVTCVMFSPEDLDIVRGAPQGRRRFVDMLLSQCGAGYYYALQTYNAALKQRNALLHDLARGGNPAQLDAWDEQLAAAAAPVVRARQYAAQNLSALSRGHYAYISGRENEPFSLRYAGCLAESAQPSEDLLRLLQRSRAEDIRRMTSTVGPHRDDLALSLAGADAHGSAVAAADRIGYADRASARGPAAAAGRCAERTGRRPPRAAAGAHSRRADAADLHRSVRPDGRIAPGRAARAQWRNTVGNIKLAISIKPPRRA